MLAQKQPFVQGVRNSSLAERGRAENTRVLNPPPKRRIPWMVGEQSPGSEAFLQESVEPGEERMLA